MKPCESAKSRLNTLDQLDQIRMSSTERRMAKAYLRQAAPLTDKLMWVHAGLCHVLGCAGQGIAALVRRSRLRTVALEPN